jgi:hypothetical protein
LRPLSRLASLHFKTREGASDTAVAEHAQADPNRWFHGYTEVQLAAIQTAVHRAAMTAHPLIKELRPRGLTHNDYHLLTQFANTYLWHPTGRPRIWIASKEAKNLKRIISLCKKIHTAVGTAVRDLNNKELVDGFTFLSNQFLVDLGRWAQVTLTSERRLSRYLADVLGLWRSIGGEFKLCRPHEGNGRDPLVEFLKAVATPVVGSAALKQVLLKLIDSKKISYRTIGEADQPPHGSVKEFHVYTEVQLAAIQTAVHRAAMTTHPLIKALRPGGLTRQDNETLLRLADIYRIERLDQMPRCTYAARSEKKLKQIVLLCKELQETIKTSCAGWPVNTVLTKFIAAFKQRSESKRYKERALSGLHGGYAPKFLLTPRGSYYHGVLCLWVAIGGDLKFSRNRKTKALQGPLVEFLKAVAGPVLGIEAVKNTSLQHVIELNRRTLDDQTRRRGH